MQLNIQLSSPVVRAAYRAIYLLLDHIVQNVEVLLKLLYTFA